LVATAQGAGVEVPTGGAGEHRILIADEQLALTEPGQCLGDVGHHGNRSDLAAFGVTGWPKL
jgi:hypothetical protein